MLTIKGPKMRRYFVAKTKEQLDTKMQNFLFAYSVKLVNIRSKEFTHSWEGCIDFEDTYGEFS